MAQFARPHFDKAHFDKAYVMGALDRVESAIVLGLVGLRPGGLRTRRFLLRYRAAVFGLVAA